MINQEIGGHCIGYVMYSKMVPWYYDERGRGPIVWDSRVEEWFVVSLQARVGIPIVSFGVVVWVVGAVCLSLIHI